MLVIGFDMDHFLGHNIDATGIIVSKKIEKKIENNRSQ